MPRPKFDFIRQQGFTTGACQDGLYSALMFQPRLVGGVVLGIMLQSPNAQPFRCVLQPRDGPPAAARHHPCGTGATKIRGRNGRHFCDDHCSDSSNRSVGRSMAARRTVGRSGDGGDCWPTLPRSHALPPVMVSNAGQSVSTVERSRIASPRMTRRAHVATDECARSDL